MPFDVKNYLYKIDHIVLTNEEYENHIDKFRKEEIELYFAVVDGIYQANAIIRNLDELEKVLEITPYYYAYNYTDWKNRDLIRVIDNDLDVESIVEEYMNYNTRLGELLRLNNIKEEIFTKILEEYEESDDLEGLYEYSETLHKDLKSFYLNIAEPYITEMMKGKFAMTES